MISRAVGPVVVAALLAVPLAAAAQTARAVDVATRPGITERVLFIAPAQPKAAAILFSGGAGDVGIADDGSVAHGGNFLVRTRAEFVRDGIAVAVLDPPSDRRSPPFLSGFRQAPQHVADVRAVIAWLRHETNLPVWLIGTSRGTQSAAFVATQLPTASAGGADGLVLTSTILVGSAPGDRAVPQMPLARIAVPVLVVHHELDGCSLCPYADVPHLMSLLTGTPRKEAASVRGGTSTGDACEAFAYHGYNGIEASVVQTIAAWITR